MQSSLETREGFAEMLHDLFSFAGVTTRQVARIMSVHERTVKNWLDGYSQPCYSETVTLFRLLNVPMTPFLENRRLFVDGNTDRDAIIDYVKNTATNEELRDMRFNLTFRHGSSPRSQMALVSMINHMTLKYRLLVAKVVLNLWDIASISGGLQYNDNTMPDVSQVHSAVVKSSQAVKDGKNSYTDI